MKRLLLCLLLATCAKVLAQEDRFNYRDSTFTIGMLLPLHGQQVYVNNKDDYVFPAETQWSVEYYQGALLALEELALQGMKAHVHLIDVTDSVALKQGLGRLQQAHLLFTLAQGEALETINRFSAAGHIPLVYALPAPFPPAIHNQFFIFSSPTLRSHAEFLFDYVYRRHFGDRILLVHRADVPQENEIAAYVVQANQRKKASGLYPLPLVHLADSAHRVIRQLQDSLSSLLHNVVLIASNDESFVQAVGMQLMRQSDKRIQLIGLPSWRNLSRLPLPMLDTLNCLVSAGFFLDRNDTALLQFRQRYQQRFQTPPSEYSVRGYDHGRYFGNQLYRFGRWMMGAFPAPQQPPLATAFKVVPVLRGEEILYRENKGIFLLVFADGNWRRQ